MLVNGGVPTKPPRDHGATYRTHYNGHGVVRRNPRPHALRSATREAWLRSFGDTMRLWQFTTSRPPGATPTSWAAVALSLVKGGASLSAAPVWPGAGSPYFAVVTMTAAAGVVTLAWSAGFVLGGNWSLHFDLRPGFNFTTTTPKSHYTVRHVEPFNSGAKPAGSVGVAIPGYWEIGETITARCWWSRLNGQALSFFTRSAVIT